ncbi:DUF72 domain-containing protein, partial [Candidatus Bathyarchaeota archaeon]|nr:DUF72 domain-containing protein [Candidatus Bathyarchaeota archaeon]
GWSYDEWIGPFYESKETPKLTYYSQVFQTVEIDSTFYAYPSEKTVYGWLRRTGSDFTFCAKLPQLITHEKVLGLKEEVEDDLERFLEVMNQLSLNGKLFAILIQLPPSLRQDLDLLESFFKLLPDNPRFTIEFRHKSWWNEETWNLLRKHNVANTIVDEPLLPPDPVVTTDFAYVRWHGRGRRPWYNYEYSVDELRSWPPKVKALENKTQSVVGYFNNHFHGYAVENCLQILEMLGVTTPKQMEAKKRAEQYIHEGRIESKATCTLTTYLAEEKETRGSSTESLLLQFMDRGRLNRAKEIGDDELHFTEKKENLLKVEIRHYNVVIDLDRKTVSHECDDWEKHFQEGRFCKHLGKLFLSLTEDEARLILEAIGSDKDSWQFTQLSMTAPRRGSTE